MKNGSAYSSKNRSACPSRKSRQLTFHEKPFSFLFMKDLQLAFYEKPFSLPCMKNRSAYLS